MGSHTDSIVVAGYRRNTLAQNERRGQSDLARTVWWIIEGSGGRCHRLGRFWLLCLFRDRLGLGGLGLTAAGLSALPITAALGGLSMAAALMTLVVRDIKAGSLEDDPDRLNHAAERAAAAST